VETHCVSHVLPQDEMKSRPAPVPVFITDPSKYRVQHSA
jgi:hypothetical protein